MSTLSLEASVITLNTHSNNTFRLAEISKGIFYSFPHFSGTPHLVHRRQGTDNDSVSVSIELRSIVTATQAGVPEVFELSYTFGAPELQYTYY